jgi:hypothetical protein
MKKIIKMKQLSMSLVIYINFRAKFSPPCKLRKPIQISSIISFGHEHDHASLNPIFLQMTVGIIQLHAMKFPNVIYTVTKSC